MSREWPKDASAGDMTPRSMPVEPPSNSGSFIPRIAISSGTLVPNRAAVAHCDSLCLLCAEELGADGIPERTERLLSWRLGNIVLTHCCDDGITLQTRMDSTAAAKSGLMRLIHVPPQSKPASLVNLHHSLEPLDGAALHLVDMACEVIATAGGQSTIFIPYAAIGYDPAAHPHYMRISLDSAAGSILCPAAEAIWTALDDVQAYDAPKIAAGLCGILRGLVTTHESHVRKSASAAVSRRKEIVAYIEDHLHDPKLGITMIKQHMHTARSTLFRDFETFGGVERYARRRRLEHAYLTLAHSERIRGGIDALARKLGFSSHSHFSRAFSAEFGCPPAEVRGRARFPDPEAGGGEGAPSAGLDTIAAWLSEISRHQKQMWSD